MVACVSASLFDPDLLALGDWKLAGFGTLKPTILVAVWVNKVSMPSALSLAGEEERLGRLEGLVGSVKERRIRGSEVVEAARVGRSGLAGWASEDIVKSCKHLYDGWSGG